ncbi:MAG: sialate O-acetylesterase [Pedobacter sp.]|uniref:sialate O-acetylesterase n=1 Tax=Pedobacter sp. TaxID=1411316 RepID=UPI003564FFEB
MFRIKYIKYLLNSTFNVVLIALLFFCIEVNAQQRRLYLVAGQSNCVGAGDSTKSVHVLSSTAFEYKHKDKSLVELSDPVGENFFGFGRASSGSAWPAFAKQLHELTSDTIMLVPAGRGGSSCHAKAEMRDYGTWDKGGYLLEHSVSKTKAAMELTSLPLSGIVWIQGERDANAINSGDMTAKEYRQALESVVDRFRNEMGKTVPFYIVSTGNYRDHSTSGFEQVRQMQDAVAKSIPGVSVVYTQTPEFIEKGWMRDAIHYSQPGLNDVGTMAATKVAALMRSKSVKSKSSHDFPLVMFDVPFGNENFSKVRSMGFNYVHVYALTTGKYDSPRKKIIQDYLDLAKKHNMKVMLDLGGTYLMKKDSAGQIFADFKQLIKDFQHHPAVGMWYLFDEPEWHSVANPQKIKKYYAFLKAQSPDIPVTICFSTKTNRNDPLKYVWKDFVNETDIIAFDTYPVYGQKFPEARLTNVTDFTAEVQKEKKPVMPTLQMFNWRTIPGVVAKAKAGTYHIKVAGKDPTVWRYPNSEELRYWCFSSLVQGVQGLMFYSYRHSGSVEFADPDWMDKNLIKVMKETTDFIGLVKGGSYVQEIIQSENTNVLSAIWKNGSKSMLVITNQSSAKQVVCDKQVLTYLKTNSSKWGLSRNINMSKVGMKQCLELAPWEVMVVKIDFK